MYLDESTPPSCYKWLSTSSYGDGGLFLVSLKLLEHEWRCGDQSRGAAGDPERSRQKRAVFWEELRKLSLVPDVGDPSKNPHTAERLERLERLMKRSDRALRHNGAADRKVEPSSQALTHQGSVLTGAKGHLKWRFGSKSCGFWTWRWFGLWGPIVLVGTFHGSGQSTG